jgi:acid phosphatase family membrane protein YuiD
MTFPLFLIPLLVGLIAQSLKPLLNRRWYARLQGTVGHKLPRYGGMPSAHTAFAFSLATTVGLSAGFSSAAFAIAATVLVLILDDALRMRIFLSQHGRALRRLILKLPAAERRAYPYLETRLGHKPSEVFAGATLGIFLTLAFLYILRYTF